MSYGRIGQKRQLQYNGEWGEYVNHAGRIPYPW
jgi:hypothetical protein